VCSNVRTGVALDLRQVTELSLQQSVCTLKVNHRDCTKCIFAFPFGGEN
jgi:hypothetical protein